uniref:3FTx-Cac-236 n=2 Tax=Elapidae TaxID=8602 RepID=R4FIB4_9SAUR
MKTLLLTLMVVTIVCLDLGYTLVCVGGPVSYEDVVCEKHQTICYRYSVCPFRGRVVIMRGCSASCPGGNNHVCCSTDRCNK